MCSLLGYKGLTLDCWGAGASKNGGEAANFCEFFLNDKTPLLYYLPALVVPEKNANTYVLFSDGAVAEAGLRK